MGRTVISPIAADYAFANSLKGQRGSFMGGWHPMGYIGLNVQADDPVIPLTCFDDQREDDTIGYD